jgi:hypothetical protein
MHKLHELKDKLIGELEDYSENGKYSKDDVEAIKYMASAVDHIGNICKDIEEDGEYSSRSYPDGMGGSYRGYSREGNRSYARGRMNARRDSMGRYSRDDGMIEELRGLMHDAPNEAIRKDIQRLVDKMEQM